jgi:hypothetical protein
MAPLVTPTSKRVFPTKTISMILNRRMDSKRMNKMRGASESEHSSLLCKASKGERQSNGLRLGRTMIQDGNEVKSEALS